MGRIGWLPPKKTGCGPSRCWNYLTKSPVGPPGAPPGQWWADGCGRWPRCCAPWHGRRPGNLPQRSLGVGPYHIPAHVLRPTGGGGTDWLFRGKGIFVNVKWARRAENLIFPNANGFFPKLLTGFSKRRVTDPSPPHPGVSQIRFKSGPNDLGSEAMGAGRCTCMATRGAGSACSSCASPGGADGGVDAGLAGWVEVRRPGSQTWCSSFCGRSSPSQGGVGLSAALMGFTGRM